MKWIEELDDLLATVEDTTKGSEGDMITKARGLIQEQRSKAGQHETIVMPPLSIKAKRTMPVEMVVREEYEQIKTFYKDVFHLLGSMNYDPDAKNVTDLLNRAKVFVEKHEY